MIAVSSRVAALATLAASAADRAATRSAAEPLATTPAPTTTATPIAGAERLRTVLRLDFDMPHLPEVTSDGGFNARPGRFGSRPLAEV